jgi:hypothetical protein
MAKSHPYRSPPTVEPRAVRESDDALATAQRYACYFVVGWALLRVGICTTRGLDLEGVVALVVLVTAIHR